MHQTGVEIKLEASQCSQCNTHHPAAGLDTIADGVANVYALQPLPYRYFTFYGDVAASTGSARTIYGQWRAHPIKV